MCLDFVNRPYPYRSGSLSTRVCMTTRKFDICDYIFGHKTVTVFYLRPFCNQNAVRKRHVAIVLLRPICNRITFRTTFATTVAITSLATSAAVANTASTAAVANLATVGWRACKPFYFAFCYYFLVAISLQQHSLIYFSYNTRIYKHIKYKYKHKPN